jgi:hypothetical protein
MVYEGNVHTGPDRIFSVSGRAITTVAEGPQLNWPNGVKWDTAGRRWIVVSFNRFHGDVAAMPGGNDSSRLVLRSGKGQLDGVDILPGGGIIFAAWSDSAIHVWKDGRDTRVIRHMLEPADIGIDTRRGRVLVPLTVVGQVQVWDLGPWWTPKK